jgi:hypothetical protein
MGLPAPIPGLHRRPRLLPLLLRPLARRPVRHRPLAHQRRRSRPAAKAGLRRQLLHRSPRHRRRHPLHRPAHGSRHRLRPRAARRVTFAVFTALGLGLAAPYLLLSFNPPGPHPAQARRLDGDPQAAHRRPLFATAIWLAWVYGQLLPSDRDGVDQLASPPRLLPRPRHRGLGARPMARPWPSRHRRRRSSSRPRHRPPHALPISPATKPATTLNPHWAALLPAGPRLRPRRRPSRLHRLHRRLVPQLPVQRARRPQIRRRRAPVQQAHNVTLLKADWTHQDPEITRSSPPSAAAASPPTSSTPPPPPAPPMSSPSCSPNPSYWPPSSVTQTRPRLRPPSGWSKIPPSAMENRRRGHL